MTSLQGYMDGSRDYKQMYNIKDLRGNLPKPVLKQNTIFNALGNNEQGTAFFSLLEKVPELAAKYNSIQADFTVFVPINVESDNLDYYKARQLILFHTLERTLSVKFLQNSRAMVINTLIPGSRILVENINGSTILNRSAIIVGVQYVGNAVLYYIDNALRMDANPNSNMDI